MPYATLINKIYSTILCFTKKGNVNVSSNCKMIVLASCQ